MQLQDVFKTFSRRLQRRLQDVFKTFSRRLQDISSTRRLGDQKILAGLVTEFGKISFEIFHNKNPHVIQLLRNCRFMNRNFKEQK